MVSLPIAQSGSLGHLQRKSLITFVEYGHHHTTTEGGAGTHGSNLTHSGIGQSSTGQGTSLSGNDMTGRHTDSSGYGTHSAGTAGAGPHSSNLANKADPRVDSDLGRSIFSISCAAAKFKSQMAAVVALMALPALAMVQIPQVQV